MLNLINAKIILKEKLEAEFDPKKVKEILELVDLIVSLQKDITLTKYIKLTNGGLYGKKKV